MAISQGLTILSWHENLAKHELPPEHLWEDGTGLEMWFATVEEKRKDDPLGQNQSSGSDESPGRDVAENDYARALRAGS